MQSKEIKSVLAKNFQEFWEDLTPSGKEDLRYDLKNRLHCSDMAIVHWRKGERIPTYIHRKEITAACSKLAGVRLNINVLFPPVSC